MQSMCSSWLLFKSQVSYLAAFACMHPVVEARSFVRAHPALEVEGAAALILASRCSAHSWWWTRGRGQGLYSRKDEKDERLQVLTFGMIKDPAPDSFHQVSYLSLCTPVAPMGWSWGSTYASKYMFLKLGSLGQAKSNNELLILSFKAILGSESWPKQQGRPEPYRRC